MPAAAASGRPGRALAAIQGQLAEARSRGFTDNHPDVIALKSQMAAAQAAARSEPVSAGGGANNPLYLSLKSMQADKQATVASLTMRKTQLQGDLDTINAKLAGDPAVAAEQSQIENDYQVLKDQYGKLLAEREAIKLRGQAQSQTDSVKFSVIDPPTAPRVPTAPNRPLLLTGVLLAGICGGIGAAFAMGQLQDHFRDREPARARDRHAGDRVDRRNGDPGADRVASPQAWLFRRRGGGARRRLCRVARRRDAPAGSCRMTEMTPRKVKGSLLERAAQVYDFAVPPVERRAQQAPRELQGQAVPFQPLPELQELAPQESAPQEFVPQEPVSKPIREAATDEAPRPSIRIARRSGAVSIDRAMLAEKGLLVPDAPIGALVEEFRQVKRQLLQTARVVKKMDGDRRARCWSARRGPMTARPIARSTSPSRWRPSAMSKCC